MTVLRRLNFVFARGGRRRRQYFSFRTGPQQARVNAASGPRAVVLPGRRTVAKSKVDPAGPRVQLKSCSRKARQRRQFKPGNCNVNEDLKFEFMIKTYKFHVTTYMFLTQSSYIH